MSFTPRPDANSEPPVDSWTMPSLSASAKARMAALRVSLLVTLIAGKAYSPFLAPSSIAL